MEVLRVMAILTIMTESNNLTSANAVAQMHLWKLISPSLPIGAYAYSQGLETAVEKNWLGNEQETLNWISGILTHSLGRLDAPVLARLYQAWQHQDFEVLNDWNRFLLASRESSELFEEDRQMGRALWRLLNDLLSNPDDSQHNNTQFHTFQHDKRLIEAMDSPVYLTVFTLAAVLWGIPLQQAMQGFLWSWCENQVAAAIKLVPLGQTSGQKILGKLIPTIDTAVHQALVMSDDDIGALAPGFGIVCAQHEVQYSRLFRS